MGILNDLKNNHVNLNNFVSIQYPLNFEWTNDLQTTFGDVKRIIQIHDEDNVVIRNKLIEYENGVIISIIKENGITKALSNYELDLKDGKLCLFENPTIINGIDLRELKFSITVYSETKGFLLKGVNGEIPLNTFAISKDDTVSRYSNGVILRQRTEKNGTVFKLYCNKPLTQNSLITNPDNLPEVIIG